MKRFIQGEHRTQGTLLPVQLDDYISEDNPVRVVDVFVEGLDLASLEFDRVMPASTGRPSGRYRSHPRHVSHAGPCSKEVFLGHGLWVPACTPYPVACSLGDGCVLQPSGQIHAERLSGHETQDHSTTGSSAPLMVQLNTKML
jgi:hypothetical protein